MPWKQITDETPVVMKLPGSISWWLFIVVYTVLTLTGLKLHRNHQQCDQGVRLHLEPLGMSIRVLLGQGGPGSGRESERARENKGGTGPILL